MEQNLSNLVRPMKVVAQEAINYVEGRKTHEVVSLQTRWKKFNKQCMGGIEPNTIFTIGGISGSGDKVSLNCNQLERKYNRYLEHCRLYLEEYRLSLGKYGELWEETAVVNSEITKGSESPYSVETE